MEREGARECLDHLALDLTLGGQELGEATERLRGAPAHASPSVGVATRSCRKGLVARSRPIEVCSPCPGKTTMLSANGSTLLRRRLEEHTSELQSLMRISYAVFCLKKKHEQMNNNRTQQG